MLSISAGSSPRCSQAGAGEALLESYDIERRPASARAAEVSLKNYRRLVSAAQRAEIYSPTPEGEAARRVIGERLVEENEKILAAGRRASWLHLPSVADRGAGRQPDAARTTPSAIGRRHFPARGRRMSGSRPERSILDLFGDGFVLLKFADAPTDGIERAAASRGVPLKVHRIEHSESRGALRARAGAGAARRPCGMAWRYPAARCDRE